MPRPLRGLQGRGSRGLCPFEKKKSENQPEEACRVGHRTAVRSPFVYRAGKATPSHRPNAAPPPRTPGPRRWAVAGALLDLALSSFEPRPAVRLLGGYTKRPEPPARRPARPPTPPPRPPRPSPCGWGFCVANFVSRISWVVYSCLLVVVVFLNKKNRTIAPSEVSPWLSPLAGACGSRRRLRVSLLRACGCLVRWPAGCCRRVWWPCARSPRRAWFGCAICGSVAVVRFPSFVSCVVVRVSFPRCCRVRSRPGLPCLPPPAPRLVVCPAGGRAVGRRRLPGRAGVPLAVCGPAGVPVGPAVSAVGPAGGRGRRPGPSRAGLSPCPPSWGRAGPASCRPDFRDFC